LPIVQDWALRYYDYRDNGDGYANSNGNFCPLGQIVALSRSYFGRPFIATVGSKHLLGQGSNRVKMDQEKYSAGGADEMRHGPATKRRHQV